MRAKVFPFLAFLAILQAMDQRLGTWSRTRNWYFRAAERVGNGVGEVLATAVGELVVVLVN